MRQFIFSTSMFLLLFLSCSQAQEPATRPHCQNTDFDKTVSEYLNFSVPVIGVEALKKIQQEVVLFDTRKKQEYDVSHIAGAKYLGYKDFDPSRLENIPKDKKIVLYCSIGYRSEKIGEQLIALGYTNVFNLYGSIFEWVNQGNPVVDQNNKRTKKVHTYNKSWSKWLEQQKAEKIW